LTHEIDTVIEFKMTRTPKHTLINLALLPKLWLTSKSVRRYALARNLPGLVFDQFGRKAGKKLFPRSPRAAIIYLINPMSATRYFEFEFAFNFLPKTPQRCLDVSSPRLFSLYVAARQPETHVSVINPDLADLSVTSQLASAFDLSNISVESCAIDRVSCDGGFDCIWSLSVIEHIAGAYDDRAAIGMMYNLLVPGGRLILTFPVDREYRLEYRDHDDYGTQPIAEGGKVFFQRNYDAHAIEERLISVVKQSPSVMRWFGEDRPRSWARHEERCNRLGLRGSVLDPKEIADNWREWESWEVMPGWGVCGMVIDKPAMSIRPDSQGTF
jgi:SAM-dependent methyltransferase